MPFAIECKKTYDIPEKDEKVWVTPSTSDAGKCFCSLNICFIPDGTQPWTAVIFRRKGKQISAVEKEVWDPDIDVYFQPNAWADGGVCTEWAKRTLKPAVQGKHHFVLFCDNLEGQKNLKFKDAVLSCGGTVWYGLASATDIWQLVDAGYGQLLKGKTKQEFFRWLDDDGNCDHQMGRGCLQRVFVIKTCWFTLSLVPENRMFVYCQRVRQQIHSARRYT